MQHRPFEVSRAARTLVMPFVSERQYCNKMNDTILFLLLRTGGDSTSVNFIGRYTLGSKRVNTIVWARPRASRSNPPLFSPPGGVLLAVFSCSRVLDESATPVSSAHGMLLAVFSCSRVLDESAKFMSSAHGMTTLLGCEVSTIDYGLLYVVSGKKYTNCRQRSSFTIIKRAC